MILKICIVYASLNNAYHSLIPSPHYNSTLQHTNWASKPPGSVLLGCYKLKLAYFKMGKIFLDLLCILPNGSFCGGGQAKEINLFYAQWKTFLSSLQTPIHPSNVCLFCVLPRDAWHERYFKNVCRGQMSCQMLYRKNVFLLNCFCFFSFLFFSFRKA